MPPAVPPVVTLFRSLIAHRSDALPDESDESRVAHAFAVLVTTGFLTKIGDAIANPKITLTWLLQLLGAGPLAISLLVPVRESLSMLPQAVIAGWVDRHHRVRWIHQLGTAVQALAVLGMAGTAWWFEGALAGWIIIALLVVFSLARCLCSLVSKAILGKTIPKRLRGQTTGWSASAAGFAAVLIGGLLLVIDTTAGSLSTLLALLLVATGAWLIATLVYARLEEPADPAAESGPNGSSLRDRLGLLGTDPVFRRFVIARGLLMSSALVAPYYILLAGESNAALATFGFLIIASGLASLLAGPFWGRFSDISSRRVLQIAGMAVGVLGFASVLLGLAVPDLFALGWAVPCLYFCLELAHQGIRVGRKTYIVDFAGDARRVALVSTANTLIGALLLLAGVLTGAAATILPPLFMIALLSAAALAGVVMARTLPDVENTDQYE